MVLKSDFYKVGIVVDSLDEAVAFHRTLFDYDWRRIPSPPEAERSRTTHATAPLTGRARKRVGRLSSNTRVARVTDVT